MNCKQFQGSMSAWIDGETDSRLSDAIESHLAVCPACRRAAEKLRTLGGLVRAPATLPLPERFAEVVMHEVRSRFQRQADSADLWQWWHRLAFPAQAGIALAALLLMCVGAFMGTGVTPDYGSPKTAALATSRDVAASMAQPLAEPGIETPAGAYLALTNTSERNR